MNHDPEYEHAHAHSTAAPQQESDAALIEQVRGGQARAFEVLYSRHRPAASYTGARQLDNASDVEDVVAEAFASVYQSLVSGKGPDLLFRPYLLAAVRNIAYRRNRKSASLSLTDSDYLLDSPVTDDDVVLQNFESSAIVGAYSQLPERWQSVLWYVDVEGLKPSAAAVYIGLSANGVSSLLIRAREGLRRAYLQEHIAVSSEDPCAQFTAHLGAYSRGGLRHAARKEIRIHLRGCVRCTTLLADLNDVQSRMRAVIFPLTTGIVFNNEVPTVFAGPKNGHLATPNLSKTFVILLAGGVVMTAVIGMLFWGNRAHEVPIPIGHPILAQTPSRTPSPTPTSTATTSPQPTQTPATDDQMPPAPQPEPSTPPVSAPVDPSTQSAKVFGSGTVTSGVEPLSSSTPPKMTQTVSSSMRRVLGSTAFDVTLEITFALHGTGSPSTAHAIFSVPSGTTFNPTGLTIGPEWTCVLSTDERQAHCETSTLDPGSLEFAFSVTVSDASQPHNIEFEFAGQGIIKKTFANAF